MACPAKAASRSAGSKPATRFHSARYGEAGSWAWSATTRRTASTTASGSRCRSSCRASVARLSCRGVRATRDAATRTSAPARARPPRRGRWRAATCRRPRPRRAATRHSSAPSPSTTVVGSPSGTNCHRPPPGARRSKATGTGELTAVPGEGVRQRAPGEPGDVLEASRSAPGRRRAHRPRRRCGSSTRRGGWSPASASEICPATQSTRRCGSLAASASRSAAAPRRHRSNSAESGRPRSLLDHRGRRRRRRSPAGRDRRPARSSPSVKRSCVLASASSSVWARWSTTSATLHPSHRVGRCQPDVVPPVEQRGQLGVLRGQCVQDRLHGTSGRASVRALAG